MRIEITACNSIPVNITLKSVSNELVVEFDDGNTFVLPVEYLRVYTQSAEAVGHGPGQDVLQMGKEQVRIIDIRRIGQYAIGLSFDDGHDSGIYTWDLLYKLGKDYPVLWAAYLDALTAAGIQRAQPLLH